MELGFPNPSVCIAVEDEADYTGLQRDRDGYEQLQEPGNTTLETQDDSEYIYPQEQAVMYEEIPDCRKSQSDTDDHQQPAGYLDMSQSATSDPQEQPLEYGEMLDSRRYDTQSQYNGCVDSGETDNEYDGQVHVFDYEATN